MIIKLSYNLATCDHHVVNYELHRISAYCTVLQVCAPVHEIMARKSWRGVAGGRACVYVRTSTECANDTIYYYVAKHNLKSKS